jgi:3-isopropylmalate/(R)-2-methylmalate dehydratase small subunit
MIPFTNFESRAMKLPINNVDTDQIIPARFLKTTSKQGLDKQLFNDWRQDPDFVLNRRESQGLQILLAGDNFGCGSSREHAPWALTQWGFRAVISTSFADIFRGNALKNSLLPIVVPADVHQALFAAIEKDPDARVKIDLATQKLALPDGRAVEFPVDAFSKQCLLDGVDELGYILKRDAAIAAFEAHRTDRSTRWRPRRIYRRAAFLNHTAAASRLCCQATRGPRTSCITTDNSRSALEPSPT